MTNVVCVYAGNYFAHRNSSQPGIFEKSFAEILTFFVNKDKKNFSIKENCFVADPAGWMSYIHAQLYSVFLSFNFWIQHYKLCFKRELYPEPYLEPCKTSQMEWFVKYLTAATSKTWTGTLDPDPEKPGPSKTWILKNLDPEKPGPWKTWTLKNLDPKKPGSWKAWILKNMEWIWD